MEYTHEKKKTQEKRSIKALDTQPFFASQVELDKPNGLIPALLSSYFSPLSHVTFCPTKRSKTAKES